MESIIGSWGDWNKMHIAQHHRTHAWRQNPHMIDSHPIPGYTTMNDLDDAVEHVYDVTTDEELFNNPYRSPIEVKRGDGKASQHLN